MVGRILSIGECMVELRQAEGGLMRKGFAGDTFNTAYYLRAFLPAAYAVDYFTAIGTDPVSDEMLAFMQSAGIGTSLIRRVPHRTPGLYMIHLKGGERSFTYWRSNSAARLLADDSDALRAAIDASEMIFFSGITLAILAPAAVETLLAELGRARAVGKLIAFDPNIRPGLWDNPDTMRRMIAAGARLATIVMPGFEDEATHFGDASVSATIDRYRSLGVEKLVVKNGASGITLSFGEERTFLAAVPAAKVVDTTGAGDSFNGAFLASWMQGDDPPHAAEFAASVAAQVVGQHGALVKTGISSKLK
ncbi:2-dehydro-3-deoxygluconokinase [Mesorhizobium sp. Root157]|uniref:sugar kinase n=1 Tax=Mesorhizobium sp. Root157 TaxID=1736477 RepID=UPI0006F69E63|nr:sugar kinase [Mesorhizobium sp. Root157]KQZ99853.1 2-dehydro-3-deoxygluconokinase [Mesorhizobium sp. Root157]